MYTDVDPENPEHLYSIEKISLNLLRKLVCHFGKGKSSAMTKPKALKTLDDIRNCERTAETLRSLSSNRAADKSQNVVAFLRLIGVLFSANYAPRFAKLNDQQKVIDFEVLAGRNHELFYKAVATEVNDGTCELHKFVIACADAHPDKQEYDDCLQRTRHWFLQYPEPCLQNSKGAFNYSTYL